MKDTDDINYRNFNADKTGNASKKTQSQISLGNDAPETQKEFHINRKDKEKSERVSEFGS